MERAKQNQLNVLAILNEVAKHQKEQKEELSNLLYIYYLYEISKKGEDYPIEYKNSENGESNVDHLNSSKCLTNEQGKREVLYEYRSFGSELKKLGTGDAKYTYGGKEYDKENSLLYFNARFMDPTLGRFITLDPAKDGTNHYIYCYDNPLSFKDPTGLSGIDDDIDAAPNFESIYIRVGSAAEPWVIGGKSYPARSSSGGYGAAPNAFFNQNNNIKISANGGNASVSKNLSTSGSITNNLWQIGKELIQNIGNAIKSITNGQNKSTNFIVDPSGQTFPVPKNAKGPTPVINPSGKQTGSAYTGGSGGENGQVDTIRIMNPTTPKGNSPGYKDGYIKYENQNGQGVNPYSGKTIPNTESHFPIKKDKE